jgi:hypothetical protein
MHEFSLSDLLPIGLMLLIIVAFMVGRQVISAPAGTGGNNAPRPKSRRAARQAPADEEPSALARRPAPEQAPAPRALRLREWLSIVNDEPDDAPHLFIYGASGTGKTTLAQAILGDRLGQVAIFDPKNKPGKWGGAPVFGVNRDGSYTTIDAGFRGVIGELRRRQGAMLDGAEDFAPLTVVLDELPLLNRNTEHAGLVLKEVSEIGRELRVRLMILSWSKRVRELGIDGAGDTIDQFVTITLRRATRRKLGFLAWDEDHYAIDLSEVAARAREPLAATRFWSPATPDADRLLAGLLDTPTVPNGGERANGGAPHQNASERAAEGSENGNDHAERGAPVATGTRSENALDPPPTPEELRKLAKALRVRADGKHAAIYAGWGLKRGGGPLYRRAEAIYEAAIADED